MKQQLMRVLNANVRSRFFKATAFALVLSSATYAGTAAPDPGTKNTVVKHLATTSQSLFFEVKIANETGEKFSVSIKDENGNNLYRGVYSDKNFVKKFKLPRTVSDKLVFVVRTAAGNTTEAFEISSNTKVMEEIIVTKL
jgi:hypothetical protein